MNYLTISDLARETGEPPHVVNHAIRLHGPEPAARVGIARVWTRAQLSELRKSLGKTAARSTRPGRRDKSTSKSAPRVKASND